MMARERRLTYMLVSKRQVFWTSTLSFWLFRVGRWCRFIHAQEQWSPDFGYACILPDLSLRVLLIERRHGRALRFGAEAMSNFSTCCVMANFAPLPDFWFGPFEESPAVAMNKINHMLRDDCFVTSPCLEISFSVLVYDKPQLYIPCINPNPKMMSYARVRF